MRNDLILEYPQTGPFWPKFLTVTWGCSMAPYLAGLLTIVMHAGDVVGHIYHA
jgi:hypothetical protein